MNTILYRKLGLTLAFASALAWPAAYLAGVDAGASNLRQIDMPHSQAACDCPPAPIKSFRMGLSEDQPLFPRNITP